ncbi:MAG: hypothetical protein M3069_05115, partial [Chloroflexota bacterium]|nr:hypothetical protein [Chloroflexota bacterium]
RALDAVEFLKTRSRVHPLRSLRVALYRARLDVRQASLLRAVVIEVRRFLHRKGMLSDVGRIGLWPRADLTSSSESGMLSAEATEAGGDHSYATGRSPVED